MQTIKEKNGAQTIRRIIKFKGHEDKDAKTSIRVLSLTIPATERVLHILERRIRIATMWDKSPASLKIFILNKCAAKKILQLKVRRPLQLV